MQFMLICVSSSFLLLLHGFASPLAGQEPQESRDATERRGLWLGALQRLRQLLAGLRHRHHGQATRKPGAQKNWTVWIEGCTCTVWQVNSQGLMQEHVHHAHRGKRSATKISQPAYLTFKLLQLQVTNVTTTVLLPATSVCQCPDVAAASLARRAGWDSPPRPSPRTEECLGRPAKAAAILSLPPTRAEQNAGSAGRIRVCL